MNAFIDAQARNILPDKDEPTEAISIYEEPTASFDNLSDAIAPELRKNGNKPLAEKPMMDFPSLDELQSLALELLNVTKAEGKGVAVGALRGAREVRENYEGESNYLMDDDES